MELKELSIKDKEIVTALFKDVFTNEPWHDDWSDRNQLMEYMREIRR